MTGGLSPGARRRTAARAGGYGRVLAAGSGAAVSAPARAGFLARFEREVDPDGLLPEAERQTLAKAALSLHMSQLALRRGAATAKKKGPASPPVAPPATPPMSWDEFLATRETAGQPSGGNAQTATRGNDLGANSRTPQEMRHDLT